MRPILNGDVSNAARALLAAPESARERLCARLFREAEAAHRYMRRSGRPHAAWGNGSLMAAARSRQLADEPEFDDADCCRCVVMVLERLLASA